MRNINLIMFAQMILMFVLIILMSQIGNRLWMKNNSAKAIYIFPDQPVDNEMYTFRSLMSFFLLLNLLVPMDLSIETLFAKFFVVTTLKNDAEFVDLERSLETGEIAKCEVNNYDMLEDFAKVNHLFCDKTGTLTKN